MAGQQRRRHEMTRRFETRLSALETQVHGADGLAGTGLAFLLAWVAQHPAHAPLALPETWETDPPARGLARCLWEIHHGQANLP
jgi:hypothetical protein